MNIIANAITMLRAVIDEARAVVEAGRIHRDQAERRQQRGHQRQRAVEADNTGRSRCHSVGCSKTALIGSVPPGRSQAGLSEPCGVGSERSERGASSERRQGLRAAAAACQWPGSGTSAAGRGLPIGAVDLPSRVSAMSSRWDHARATGSRTRGAQSARPTSSRSRRSRRSPPARSSAPRPARRRCTAHGRAGAPRPWRRCTSRSALMPTACAVPVLPPLL